MNIRCYFDTHIRGPIAILEHEVLSESPSKHLYLGGDIVELRNAAYADLEKNRFIVSLLKARHGENYIPGNHDDEELINRFIIGVSETTGKRFGIFHGDIETNPDRYWAQRREKKGASALKRKFLVPALEKLEGLRGLDYTDQFVSNVFAQMVTFDLDIFIGGHRHPKKTIDKTLTHKGKARQIITCMRGCSEFDL